MKNTICKVLKKGKYSEILSPSVGIFIRNFKDGDMLCPGAHIGYFYTQNIIKSIRIPIDTMGKITFTDNGKIETRVEYGEVLFTISQPEEDLIHLTSNNEKKEGIRSYEGLLIRSFITGIFYRRATPDSPPFTKLGALVKKGDTLGLIEVMKSFNRIILEGENNFKNGIIEEIFVEDNSEVKQGDPLFRISVK